MYSLYHSLLAQHPRQLIPLRCAGSTIAQLHRYFEDVVLENNLSALVVESLSTSVERPARDAARLQELDKTARNLFLWLNRQDALQYGASRGSEKTNDCFRTNRQRNLNGCGHADARFSALLASVHGRRTRVARSCGLTFEPDIVYSARIFDGSCHRSTSFTLTLLPAVRAQCRRLLRCS